MTAKRVIAPTSTPVTLAEVKLNLRIDSSDTSLDSLVTAWIEAITEYTEHYLGRALVSQTWEVTLDGFPDAIELPNPPILAVSYLKYYDTNGVLQTLATSDYVVDSVSEPGYVVPAAGTEWPDTDAESINTVICRYTCGYSTIPSAIKMYIMAKIAEQFDPATRPEKDTVQASFLDRLLDRYRLIEC